MSKIDAANTAWMLSAAFNTSTFLIEPAAPR